MISNSYVLAWSVPLIQLQTLHARNVLLPHSASHRHAWPSCRERFTAEEERTLRTCAVRGGHAFAYRWPSLSRASEPRRNSHTPRCLQVMHSLACSMLESADVLAARSA